MQPKTEELLYFLLWSCESLVRPSFRNLTDSFEGWAYKNGFDRQLAQLGQQKLLRFKAPKSADVDRAQRVLRLTEAGRLRALGGRDPESRWRRPWDRRWRLVLFDLPVAENALRNHLRKQLRGRGFGCLQKSVWITPDSLHEEKIELMNSQVDVGSLIVLEGRPCAGESNEEIVARAWNFTAINRAYAKHKALLEKLPTARAQDERAARALRAWGREERAAWLEAVALDPLLPQELLPREYLGQVTWQLRTRVLREAAEQMRSLRGESGG